MDLEQDPAGPVRWEQDARRKEKPLATTRRGLLKWFQGKHNLVRAFLQNHFLADFID